MAIDPDFRAALEGHDIDALDRWPGVIIGVRPDDTIGHRNPAWDRFAEENGGRERVGDWAPPRTVLAKLVPGAGLDLLVDVNVAAGPGKLRHQRVGAGWHWVQAPPRARRIPYRPKPLAGPARARGRLGRVGTVPLTRGAPRRAGGAHSAPRARPDGVPRARRPLVRL
jgi:hypothetical protein